MLSVAEALSAVLARASSLPPVGCPLAEARLRAGGRRDRRRRFPAFDKALVDGYAVRSTDLTGQERRLTVGETIMAGQTPSRALLAGEAAVIMTGAPLPVGCDAVVMHERTQKGADGVVVLDLAVRAGQNLLRRGAGDAAPTRL